MPPSRQHVFFIGLLLSASPSTIFADTVTREALANQITTLSLDRDKEVARREGIGWVLYPPLTSHWSQIEVDGCILTLQSFSHNNTLQTSIPIDLSIASVMHFDDELPYQFFEVLDRAGPFNPNASITASAGLLRFVMPDNEPILGQIRDNTDGTVPARMIELRVHDPTYTMLHDPSQDTLAALASAILNYQQQTC